MDGSEETKYKGFIVAIKLLNKTAYNELIISQ